jgi:predicted HicB family RNase H-like nuclease
MKETTPAGKATRKLSTIVSAELHRLLRLAAADQDISVNDLVAGILEKAMQAGKKAKP